MAVDKTQFKVGQIWIAADGGEYGHVIERVIDSIEDLVTTTFAKNGLLDASTIDMFKMTYRYKLVSEWPKWAAQSRKGV